jgi:site-specific DNA-methyltransferase (adenine-specific)
VQYVKKPIFIVDNKEMTMKEWLRYEWGRTGLPFSKTNVACGVVDAATRKYFTKCHLWYMPPSDAFGKISDYANENGKEEGKPYFSVDGVNPLTKEDWERYKPKFHCPFGVTNVWSIPQLRNKERLKKDGMKALHLNQKPLGIIKNLIEMSTDKLDVIWEPFGGLCTTAIASIELKRKCYSAEINVEVFNEAKRRIEESAH